MENMRTDSSGMAAMPVRPGAGYNNDHFYNYSGNSLQCENKHQKNSKIQNIK